MATPSQRWALALAAVLTELNQGYHHELGGWGKGEHTRGWCTNVLANSWGVKDAASFRAVTNWLWNEGHRAECYEIMRSLGPDASRDDDKIALVRANVGLLEGKSLLAWDMGRFVAVVGWGTWAGYVSEAEAWRMLHGAATWVQRTFKSWREYGRHYEFGRYYWSSEDDPRIDTILKKLNTDPRSPWLELAWTLPLGPTPIVVEPPKARIKRTVCASCGAPKQLPPRTGWVYCDCCGTLADWDFRTACSQGSALPGPAYEAIAKRLAPQLEAARATGDAARCLSLQRDLFSAWVDACPKAVPPRASEPTYRAAYVDYMAQAAAATDLDDEWQMLAIAVRGATAGIAFEGDPRKPRVRGAAFWPLYDAVRRQVERGMVVYENAGVLDRHPDGAPADLQQRLTWSVFAQGWLPFLADADAARLLEQTALEGDYVELPDVACGTRHCGGCGGEIQVVPGARCVVCEACGHRVDVGTAEIPCTQCAGTISFPESKDRVACPFCEAMVVRV
jgi:hypothetical protein